MSKQFKAEIKNEKKVRTFFNAGLTDIQRYAISGTATEVAYLGIGKSNAEFKKKFTLSNKFLTGSKPGNGLLKYNRAIPSHDINKIESSWGIPPKKGSTDLSFMDDQEVGFHHEGMVPTKNAYPSKNRKKVIKRNLRRKALQIKRVSGPGKGMTKSNRATMQAIYFLNRQYSERFAMPGSKQFIYLHKSEFMGFDEGMYQFATNSPAVNGRFPKLKMIYAKNDKVNKKRKPTNWMQDSANEIKQAEIEKIFEKQFDKSFTNAVKKNF